MLLKGEVISRNLVLCPSIRLALCIQCRHSGRLVFIYTALDLSLGIDRSFIGILDGLNLRSKCSSA